MKAIESNKKDLYKVDMLVAFPDGDIGIIKSLVKDATCAQDAPVYRVRIFGRRDLATVCTCCLIPLGLDHSVLAHVAGVGEA